MKKAVLSLVVVTFLTSLLIADGIEPPGSGTFESPYHVSILEHLIWISTNTDSWGAYCKQVLDIDASATSDLNSGSGFLPIGNNTIKFTGFYDGQNHYIDNLFIDRPATDYVGLFGYGYGSIIENISVTNCEVTGNSYVGGLAGKIHSTTISNCSDNGEVTGFGDFVGGLLGYNDSDSEINNCRASSFVDGFGEHTGGLAGFNKSSISYCSFSGYVFGAGNFVGGLTSENNMYSSVSNSYTTGAVEGDANYIGGLVGHNYFFSNVIDCYSTCSVEGYWYVAGLVGWNYASTISNSYWLCA